MDTTILSDLACPNCHLLLSRPVTLTCGHHLCASCVESLREDGSEFECPACSASIAFDMCIPNQLMERMIQELSTVKASQTFIDPDFLTEIPAYANTKYISEPEGGRQPQAQPRLLPPAPALSREQEGQLPQSASPSASSGKSQSPGSERLVLTHNQRQYIRYVVVTDCETGVKYTVGIKHVLNTAGSAQLVQLLERNIGSEYKKGSSKRVCKSVVHGGPCALDAECPFIHVTREGWEARRKFSSANQKRNKDLPDGPAHPPSPHPEAPRPPHPAPTGRALGGTASAWLPYVGLAPPLVTGSPPLPAMPHGGGLSLEPWRLPPSAHHHGLAPFLPLHFPMGGVPAGPDSWLPSPDPTVPPPFQSFPISFPIPLHGGFGPQGPVLGPHISAMSAASSVSTSTAIPLASGFVPHDSSAASTASSVGAISSISSTGSPLASPLVESLAVADLPELHAPRDAPPEEPRMAPYFTRLNFVKPHGA